MSATQAFTAEDLKPATFSYERGPEKFLILRSAADDTVRGQRHENE